MLAIIDYGMGNLRSVARALEVAGAFKVKVTSDIGTISKADKIVLPGVGAIREAMRELKRRRLIGVIRENIFSRPFLGICLGLQLLFTESEEGGNVQGLGIFKGRVRRFSDKLKVPHIGWNSINIRYQIFPPKILLSSARPRRDIGRDLGQSNAKKKFLSPLLRGISDNSYFYFCHSYYVVPEDVNLIAATTDYGLEFVSAICKDNLFACQFHPEKSQKWGLKILENFVRL